VVAEPPKFFNSRELCSRTRTTTNLFYTPTKSLFNQHLFPTSSFKTKIMPRKSLRKQGWDYSSTANYFITINLSFDSSRFGVVTKAGIQLSELGQLVKLNWEAIPGHAPNIKLGKFVIMPDHLRGIIYFTSTEDHNRSTLGEFGAQRKNLPGILRGFKSGFTSSVKSSFPRFAWQVGYHDRILFSQSEIFGVEDYIRNNPKKAIDKLIE
jgi:putative transposase